jgi:catalase (peroxidase I)
MTLTRLSLEDVDTATSHLSVLLNDGLMVTIGGMNVLDHSQQRRTGYNEGVGLREMNTLTKRFFKTVTRKACEWAAMKQQFDMLVEEKYGFHYSDKDLDEIIDSIDYGNGGLSFEEFEKIMLSNQQKSEKEEINKID